MADSFLNHTVRKLVHRGMLKLGHRMKSRNQHVVQVRTYAGEFIALRSRSGKPVSYDEYLQYAESNRNLKRVVFTSLNISDGMELRDETPQAAKGVIQFTQTVAACCLFIARQCSFAKVGKD